MTAGTILLSLGVSLGLTLVLEGVFALLCRKKGGDFWLAVLVSAVTNPVVVFLVLCWKNFSPWPQWPCILALEALAVLGEGQMLKKWGESFPRPMLYSLCANGFSYGLGLVIGALQNFV